MGRGHGMLLVAFACACTLPLAAALAGSAHGLAHRAASGAAEPEEETRATTGIRQSVQRLMRWMNSTATLQQLDFMNRLWSYMEDHTGAATTAKLSETLEELDGEWVECAREHESCQCESGFARFGAADAWVYRNWTGSFNCDVSTFTLDPKFGDLKACECRRAAQGPAPAPSGLTLLWSCASLPQGGGAALASWGNDNSFLQREASATVEQQAQLRLHASVGQFCSHYLQEHQLDVYLDPTSSDSHRQWSDHSTGWVNEAFVTYIAGKHNSKFEWMATNLIRSVHLFSGKPLIMVVFDPDFRPPDSWKDFPNLILYRMDPIVGRASFNFNKIRAMIAARVVVGVELDLDQNVFPGIDVMFAATRRESNAGYPYPILPVHWMSRDALPNEPYHEYRFTAYDGLRTMRWGHGHPTWSYHALPFLVDLLHARLRACFDRESYRRWMAEDEDMLNVMLWRAGVKKAWCKFDLEPSLFTEPLDPEVYWDGDWYPDGLPLAFLSAHNTKDVEGSDWLISLFARCSEPGLRRQAECPAQQPACRLHRLSPAEREALLDADGQAAADLCCCVGSRETQKYFWQGKWYANGSDVPTADDRGIERRCIMP